eukprot:14119683-Alexandrium_andersonii.AAC.1
MGGRGGPKPRKRKATKSNPQCANPQSAQSVPLGAREASGTMPSDSLNFPLTNSELQRTSSV